MNSAKSFRGSRLRVASGVFAHLYSQLVTVVTQIASLPLFLMVWDADRYGQWIVLSAIPVYLSISDVGILTAAGNLMSMHRARGENDELRLVFKTTLLIVTSILPLIAIVAAAALALFNFGMNVEQREALFILILSSLLSLACNLFDVIYRPFGKYARVIFLLTTARIAEWAGSIVGVFIGRDLTGAALGFFLGRALSSVCVFAMARRDIPEIEWSLKGVSRDRALKLLKIGVGFISFTVGSLLSLQGMILVVGAQVGAAAVTIFSSSRTLTRLIAQIAVLTGKSLAPEISMLHGAEKHRDAERLTRQMVWTAMTVTTVAAALLAQFGHYFWDVWLRGKLPFNRPVFLTLVLAAVGTAFWQIQSVRLTATNRHQKLALFFLAASGLGLATGYFGMSFFGLEAAALSALLSEAIMVISTTYLLGRVYRDNSSAF